jgi:hypothetical protein
MSEVELMSKVAVLPEKLKEEVSDYVDFLIAKYVSSEGSTKKPLKFGMMKGTFKMSPDFDEPLEDFKEYMP